MGGVPQSIIDRQLALFEKIDPAYAQGVRSALTPARAAE
jgi:catalase